MAKQTIEYHHPRIPLTEGLSTLIAYTVLDRQVLGSSSARIPFANSAELTDSVDTFQDPSGASLQSVNGWINAMPGLDGQKPTLHASISMWAPCANYDYELEPIGTWGFTGRTFLIRLTAKRPNDCLQAIRVTELNFAEEISGISEYDSVAVMFESEVTLDPLEIIT